MADAAKPGALLLALGGSKDEDGDKRPAKPTKSDSDDDSTTREAMGDAAKSMMSAFKRGDADTLADALDAFITARGK